MLIVSHLCARVLNRFVPLTENVGHFRDPFRLHRKEFSSFGVSTSCLDFGFIGTVKVCACAIALVLKTVDLRLHISAHLIHVRQRSPFSFESSLPFFNLITPRSLPFWTHYFRETLEGSFSAIPTPLTARVGTFFSVEFFPRCRRISFFCTFGVPIGKNGKKKQKIKREGRDET